MIIELSPNDHILSNDRISAYGDGCFTTMCVSNHRIELLEMHICRLKNSCNRLKIDFVDWVNLQEKLVEVGERYKNHVLKVVISRGYGGRGYGTAEVKTPHCYLSVSEMPNHYPALRQSGLTLGLSPIQIARQPLLAGIKHLNRLEQVLIKHEMQLMKVDEVVVCDTESLVIECCAANLFWRTGQQWFTPKLDKCGVSGVMRNFLVNLMTTNNIKLIETEQPIASLLSCEEAFVTNSLMKVIQVKELVLKDSKISLDCSQMLFVDWFKTNQQEVALNE